MGSLPTPCFCTSNRGEKQNNKKAGKKQHIADRDLLTDSIYQEISQWNTVNPTRPFSFVLCVMLKDYLPHYILKHHFKGLLVGTQLFWKELSSTI